MAAIILPLSWNCNSLTSMGWPAGRTHLVIGAVRVGGILHRLLTRLCKEFALREISPQGIIFFRAGIT